MASYERIPNYEPLGSENTNAVYKISIKKLGVLTMSLPMGAFISCVLISLAYHFESSTATHCHVRNYLPSISAAIGGSVPERYIWRICIALHAAPRYLVGFMYYRHHTNKIGRHSLMVLFNMLLYMTDISSLVALSYVSSSESEIFHSSCFVAFAISFMLYTIVTVYLMGLSRSVANKQDKYSLKMKIIFMAINMGSFASAIYCYYRHNKFCEPYVYTFFAFFEYVFVVTVVAFHGTAILDFPEHHLTIVGPLRKIR